MWKILLVEDQKVDQKLVMEILKAKAVCDVAENGKQALEAFRRSVDEKSRYDAILLDVLIPETDHGMEVLENIRKDEAQRGVKKEERVPIIMVTTFKYTAKNAYDHGCDDFIAKPVHAKRLIEKIERLVKK